MKTLFLDFDGPLFSDRCISFHPKNFEDYPGKEDIYPLVDYWKMDDCAVYMLNYLYQLEPFDTVVSSSWKKHCEKPLIDELFKLNSLMLHFANDWKTPNHYANYSCCRASEIEAYLADHPEVTDYIIIDDKGSGASLITDEIGMYCGSKPYAHSLRTDRIFIVNQEHGLDTFTFKKIRALFPMKVTGDRYGIFGN